MNWVTLSTIHFSPSNAFFRPVMTFSLPAMPFSPTKEVGTSETEEELLFCAKLAAKDKQMVEKIS